MADDYRSVISENCSSERNLLKSRGGSHSEAEKRLLNRVTEAEVAEAVKAMKDWADKNPEELAKALIEGIEKSRQNEVQRGK